MISMPEILCACRLHKWSEWGRLDGYNRFTLSKSYIESRCCFRSGCGKMQIRKFKEIRGKFNRK